METQRLPYWEARNKSLGPFLYSVVEGDDTDHRTPFWGKADRLEVITEWDRVFEDNLGLLVGRLEEVELAQREKIGPISVRLPLRERMDQVNQYYQRSWPELDQTRMIEYNSALQRRYIGKAMLRASLRKSAVDAMKLNTNSGYPRFTRRSLVVEEEMIDSDSIEYVLSLAFILGWRGSASGLNEVPKQRSLWMAPMAYNIMEYLYFMPLQKALIKHPEFSAWTTPEQVDAKVVDVMQYAREVGAPIFSTDFDSFDASIGPNHVEYNTQFKLSSFRSEHADEIEAIDAFAQKGPLIISPREALTGVHGMPSGRVFTNLDDSLVHRRAQLHVAWLAEEALWPGCQVQGDDGLLVIRGIQDVELVVEGFSEIGLPSNPEKQFVGEDDCTYLQRYYHRSSDHGMYPTYRALNSLLGQERHHDPGRWGAQQVTLRAIMILENCKYHPLFSEFVRFVQSGDKYRLGADWPGGIDSMLDTSVLKTAKEIPGFIPSWNQEQRVDGIYQFQTYRLIKESQ